MSHPRKKDRVGATPGKLALVGVLAVVLIGVIVVQLPEASENDNVAQPETVPSRRHQENDARQKSAPTSSTKSNQQTAPSQPWPQLSLEEVTAFDPFAETSYFAAPPSVATEPISEIRNAENKNERSSAQEDLLQQGATIVVIADNDKIATIGTQQLRVGDVVEGYRITDITTQGIVLTEQEEYLAE